MEREIGKEFIHVHHEKELSRIDDSYENDPIEEMKPVWPNFHAMIHKVLFMMIPMNNYVINI
ncbi:hypothetical protein ACPCF3_04765 [Enterococcus mundtii]|uniref:hypothetical protein n=1 Tax=Enterococcus spodopteracolus TaxID=3034501 RepID=UPI00264744D8|nr:hypothetical protein [Enterococcus spodopteracolus]